MDFHSSFPAWFTDNVRLQIMIIITITTETIMINNKRLQQIINNVVDGMVNDNNNNNMINDNNRNIWINFNDSIHSIDWLIDYILILSQNKKKIYWSSNHWIHNVFIHQIFFIKKNQQQQRQRYIHIVPFFSLFIQNGWIMKKKQQQIENESKKNLKS